jgi:hypothetical protein
MLRRQVTWGVLLGMLAGGILLVVLNERWESRTPEWVMLSDCDGPIRELVIQYVADSDPVVGPVYRDFLPQLPSDVTVHVLCPAQADFDALAATVGPTGCRLSPVIAGHPVTAWCRDRWIALAGADDRVRLLAGPMENGAVVWPARAGDARTSDDLAERLPLLAAERAEVLFEGGDFVADAETVFVAPGLARRNVEVTLAGHRDLVLALSQILGRRVVLLDEAPDYHAGMFMMLAGGRTAVVGDVAEGQRLLNLHATPPEGEPLPLCDGSADFSPAAREQFDAVVRRLVAEGYHVVRTPVVMGRDCRTFFTYVNVIIDERHGVRTVYLPVYRGQDEMNAAAIAAWRSLGYQVRPVDCTSAYARFGTLRCLVNVLRRGRAPS